MLLYSDVYEEIEAMYDNAHVLNDGIPALEEVATQAFSDVRAKIFGDNREPVFAAVLGDMSRQAEDVQVGLTRAAELGDAEFLTALKELSETCEERIRKIDNHDFVDTFSGENILGIDGDETEAIPFIDLNLVAELQTNIKGMKEIIDAGIKSIEDSVSAVDDVKRRVVEIDENATNRINEVTEAITRNIHSHGVMHQSELDHLDEYFFGDNNEQGVDIKALIEKDNPVYIRKSQEFVAIKDGIERAKGLRGERLYEKLKEIERDCDRYIETHPEKNRESRLAKNRRENITEIKNALNLKTRSIEDSEKHTEEYRQTKQAFADLAKKSINHAPVERVQAEPQMVQMVELTFRSKPKNELLNAFSETLFDDKDGIKAIIEKDDHFYVRSSAEFKNIKESIMRAENLKGDALYDKMREIKESCDRYLETHQEKSGESKLAQSRRNDIKRIQSILNEKIGLIERSEAENANTRTQGSGGVRRSLESIAAEQGRSTAGSVVRTERTTNAPTFQADMGSIGRS